MNFLLHKLIQYFLFAGTMFFAAGAVADVGAADGGAAFGQPRSDRHSGCRADPAINDHCL